MCHFLAVLCLLSLGVLLLCKTGERPLTCLCSETHCLIICPCSWGILPLSVFLHSQSPFAQRSNINLHQLHLSSSKAATAIYWSKVLQSFLPFAENCQRQTWKTSVLWHRVLLSDKRWSLQNLVVLVMSFFCWHASVQANKLCEYDNILQLTLPRAGTVAVMQLSRKQVFSWFI